MSAADRRDDRQLHDAITRALPDTFVEHHEPAEIEGAAPSLTIRPPDGETVGLVVRALAGAGAAALLRGGGSRLATANAPVRAQVLLELGALRAEPVLDIEEGVAWLPAGMPLAEVHARLAGSGWELPLDPPGDASTVGGALASAASGPRFAHPRDITLGLEVTLGSGERTRCGGRVVKNVSGYDLVKLYLGSFGSLAVIEAAWVRLRPAPESLWVGHAPLAEHAGEIALDASRCVTARVCAVVDGPAAVGRRLVVELAGDAPAVDADRRKLAEKCPLEAASSDEIDALRTLQGRSRGVRIRVDGLPTSSGESAALLHAAGARVLSYPGRGLSYAWLEDTDETVLDPLLRAARHAARAGQGAVRIEAGPVAVRAGHEVFGADPALVPLHRALKRQYDPAGVLNPGRFLGGV